MKPIWIAIDNVSAYTIPFCLKNKPIKCKFRFNMTSPYGFHQWIYPLPLHSSWTSSNLPSIASDSRRGSFRKLLSLNIFNPHFTAKKKITYICYQWWICIHLIRILGATWVLFFLIAISTLCLFTCIKLYLPFNLTHRKQLLLKPFLHTP